MKRCDHARQGRRRKAATPKQLNSSRMMAPIRRGGICPKLNLLMNDWQMIRPGGRPKRGQIIIDIFANPLIPTVIHYIKTSNDNGYVECRTF